MRSGVWLSSGPARWFWSPIHRLDLGKAGPGRTSSKRQHCCWNRNGFLRSRYVLRSFHSHQKHRWESMMGQTLWQRLTKGREVVEFKYTNPAKAKIGSSFSLDVIGYRDLMFTLREIHDYKRTINGKTINFADYVLLARPIGKEDVEIRLRFMPVAVPDAQLTHNIVVLTKYDEMGFNQGLDGALRDTTGELIVTENSVDEKYWRLNGHVLPYNADVAIVRDINNDGKVESDEVENVSVEYWDFSRITTDEAQQQYTQYLFVELDKDSKVQTMWRGEEVDPERITVL